MLTLTGMLWTSPNSALGLLIGALGLAGGARVRWHARERALVFRRMPGPGGALALGNVILCTGDSLDVPCPTYACRAGWAAEPPIRLADHERAHVWQYMLLGPLFLPLYLLCGGVSARNRFERAAATRSAAGAGGHGRAFRRLFAEHLRVAWRQYRRVGFSPPLPCAEPTMVG